MEGYGGFWIQAEQVTSKSLDLGTFPGSQYSNFADSVGIGSYPMDTRRCPTGDLLEPPAPYSNHYQIPLRALVSANIRNLLSANKTLAVSQLANAAYRLHPTEWNAGFGAGTAAAIAVRSHQDLHTLIASPEKVREVQEAVVHAGGHVLWFSDHLPPLQ